MSLTVKDGKHYSLVVKSLQTGVVVQSVLGSVVGEDEPGGTEWPLLGDVHPTGQVVPVELYLECFQ